MNATQEQLARIHSHEELAHWHNVPLTKAQARYILEEYGYGLVVRKLPKRKPKKKDVRHWSPLIESFVYHTNWPSWREVLDSMGVFTCVTLDETLCNMDMLDFQDLIDTFLSLPRELIAPIPSEEVEL